MEVVLELLKASPTATSLATFLQFCDLQSLLGTCTSFRQDAIPCRAMMKACLRASGVPCQFRTQFWSYVAGVYILKRRKAVPPKFDLSELARHRDAVAGCGDQPMGVAGEIYRDVDRSLPWHPLFARPEVGGQAALFDALRAFAAANIDVGYCQGMNYVAGAIIAAHCCPSDGSGRGTPPPVFIKDDASRVTYWLLACLSKRYHMREVWGPGVARLRLLGHQLSMALHAALPSLHAHLSDIGMSCDMLAAQWLLPLLAASLPLHTHTRVFELFFVEGWKVMFRVLLAVLRHSEATLLAMSAPALSSFFRLWKDMAGSDRGLGITVEPSEAAACLDIINHPDTLLALSFKEKAISNAKLLVMEKQFAMNAIRHRIGDKGAAAVAGSGGRTSPAPPLLPPGPPVSSPLQAFFVPPPRAGTPATKSRPAAAATMSPPPPPQQTPPQQRSAFGHLLSRLWGGGAAEAVEEDLPAADPPTDIPASMAEDAAAPEYDTLDEPEGEEGPPALASSRGFTPSPASAGGAVAANGEELGLEGQYVPGGAGHRNATVASSLPGRTLAPDPDADASYDMMSPLSRRMVKLQDTLVKLDGPARQDANIMIAKIESLTKRLQPARAAAARADAQCATAAATLQALLDRKAALKDSLHRRMISKPLSPAKTAPGDAGDDSRTASSASSTPPPSPEASATPPMTPGQVPTRLAAETTKLDAAALRSFSQDMKRLDTRVAAAAENWRKSVWSRTMHTTELDELVLAKDAIGSQLHMLAQAAEAAKEKHMMDVWLGLARLGFSSDGDDDDDTEA